jgi:hypothetical protein
MLSSSEMCEETDSNGNSTPRSSWRFSAVVQYIHITLIERDSVRVCVVSLPFKLIAVTVGVTKKRRV